MSVYTMCISCVKYSDRWDRVRKEMARVGVENLFMVYGDPDLDEPWKLEGDVLAVRAPDIYEGLPRKVIMVYRALRDDPAFADLSYMWKIDDDLYLLGDHVPVGQYLEEQGADYIACQVIKPTGTDRTMHFGKCSDPKLNTTPYLGPVSDFAWGGATYALSKDAVKAVADWSDQHTNDEIDAYLCEDIMVGWALKGFDMLPVRNDDLGKHLVVDGYTTHPLKLWFFQNVLNLSYR